MAKTPRTLVSNGRAAPSVTTKPALVLVVVECGQVSFFDALGYGFVLA